MPFHRHGICWQRNELTSIDKACIYVFGCLYGFVFVDNQEDNLYKGFTYEFIDAFTHALSC